MRLAAVGIFVACAAISLPFLTKLCAKYWDLEENMLGSSSTFYYLISTLGVYHSKSPVVNAPGCSVQGIVSVSRDGRLYYSFLSIPYAKPPMGKLRFQPPEPLEKCRNEGILQADKMGVSCLQFDAVMRGIIWGEEDCLHLNVFTPNLRPGKLLPVIVWIHGGGFIGGEASTYNPKYFMDFDVVVVTLNYRLGALGFLNTGDGLIRGNMGLKDQNLALKWVQRNIESFGGDPKMVTLMGESAGGASVHYHVISPLSRGLFHAGIIQSGNLGSAWAFTRNPGNQAIQFGQRLNCSVENTTVLTNCLMQMDPRDIVRLHASVMSPVHTQDDFFTGSVESEQSQDTFLSQNPYLMLQSGDFAHVPIILGVTNGDGGLKTARLESYSNVLDELDSKWNEYVPILLHYDPNRTDVSNSLRKYYFNEVQTNGTIVKSSTNPAENLGNLTRMLSAGIFFEGTHRIAKLHSQHAPVFYYYYTYIPKTMPSAYGFIRAPFPRSGWSPWVLNVAQGLAEHYTKKFIWRSLDPTKYGACHGDDILQTFSVSNFVEIRPTSADYPFSKEIVKTFVHFAKDRSKLTFFNMSWPPVKVNELIVSMNLNLMGGGLIEEPNVDEIKFIESLDIRDPLETSNW